MPKRILIVDDEPGLLKAIQIRLRAAGYEVLIAYNGFECLRTAQQEKPDLILLDIVMPDLDGFGTLEKLKENIQTKSIPVIMLTSKSQLDDVTKAANLGVEDYIVKPFDSQAMLGKIKKVLQD